MDLFGDTLLYSGGGGQAWNKGAATATSSVASSSPANNFQAMSYGGEGQSEVRTNSSNIIHTEEEKWTKKVQVCTTAGSELEEPLDDGYSWRKYGQKDILGAKYPRGYYKCIHRGCPARKQVHRSNEDPTIFEITYHGRRHKCSQTTPQNPSLSSISPEKQERGQAWKAGAAASIVSACPTSFQTSSYSEGQGEFRTYSSIVSAQATSFDTVSCGERAHGQFHEHSSIASGTPSDFEMMDIESPARVVRTSSLIMHTVNGSSPFVSYYKEESPSTSVIGQEPNESDGVPSQKISSTSWEFSEGKRYNEIRLFGRNMKIN